MDQSCIDRKTFIQQLLLGRESVLHSEVCAQRRRPFQESETTVNEAHGDEGDESVAIMCADLRVIEAERDIAELSAIHDALERMEDGTFGKCEECGVDIDFERLKAQPIATHCIDCQRLRERTYWHRPVARL
jgi:DnaK suppressor protein